MYTTSLSQSAQHWHGLLELTHGCGVSLPSSPIPHTPICRSYADCGTSQALLFMSLQRKHYVIRCLANRSGK